MGGELRCAGVGASPGVAWLACNSNSNRLVAAAAESCKVHVTSVTLCFPLQSNPWHCRASTSHRTARQRPAVETLAARDAQVPPPRLATLVVTSEDLYQQHFSKMHWKCCLSRGVLAPAARALRQCVSQRTTSDKAPLSKNSRQSRHGMSDRGFARHPSGVNSIIHKPSGC